MVCEHHAICFCVNSTPTGLASAENNLSFKCFKHSLCNLLCTINFTLLGMRLPSKSKPAQLGPVKMIIHLKLVEFLLGFSNMLMGFRIHTDNYPKLQVS